MLNIEEEHLDFYKDLAAIELGRERETGGVHGLKLLSSVLELIGKGPQAFGVRAIAQLEGRELIEYRGRERQDPRDADEERDQLREARRHERPDEEVVEGEQRGDEQRRQDESGDPQTPGIARARSRNGIHFPRLSAVRACRTKVAGGTFGPTVARAPLRPLQHAHRRPCLLPAGPRRPRPRRRPRDPGWHGLRAPSVCRDAPAPRPAPRRRKTRLAPRGGLTQPDLTWAHVQSRASVG